MRASWCAFLVVWVTLLLAIAAVPFQGVPNPVTLAMVPGLVNALKDGNDAFDDLSKVKKIAEDIDAGRTPDSGGNWGKFADKYDVAAKAAKNAPLPSAIDLSAYAISASELSNCTTRPAALTKLQGYLQGLQSAKQSGDGAVAQLDSQLQQIPTAQQALAYIIRIHEKLMVAPVIGNKFAWDWLDLNTRVSKSLGDYQTALKDQRKRFADDLALLNTRIGNLQANLTALRQLPCSPITGGWSGSGGGSTVQFGGGPSCAYRVTLSNVQVNASVAQNGQVMGASASATMQEVTVGGGCGNLGTRPHHFSFAGGSTNGNRLSFSLSGAGNAPRGVASLIGSVTGGRIVGTLTVHRTDSVPAFNWTVQVPIH